MDVASEADLSQGVPVVVKAEGRGIALVRWRERIYAIRDVCPHQSASFVGGITHDILTGGDTMPELKVIRDDPVLVCPWHGYQVRLQTGRCIAAPALRARTYEVAVREGRVLVDVGRGPAATAGALMARE